MLNKSPTSSSMCLHRIDSIEAEATPENSECLRISFYRDGWETFDIAVFTNARGLSQDLADAINAVLKKHGRFGEAPTSKTEE